MTLSEAYAKMREGALFIHPRLAGVHVGFADNERPRGARETMHGQPVAIRDDGSWSSYKFTVMDTLDDWVAV